MLCAGYGWKGSYYENDLSFWWTYLKIVNFWWCNQTPRFPESPNFVTSEHLFSPRNNYFFPFSIDIASPNLSFLYSSQQNTNTPPTTKSSLTGCQHWAWKVSTSRNSLHASFVPLKITFTPSLLPYCCANYLMTLINYLSSPHNPPLPPSFLNRPQMLDHWDAAAVFCLRNFLMMNPGADSPDDPLHITLMFNTIRRSFDGEV